MANSRKTGDKCIAGIEPDTGKWIRPVRPGGGALSLDSIRYRDGSYPKALDIINVPVIGREPLYYQPENWIIDEDIYWTKAGVSNKELLMQYCSSEEHVFYDQNDCIHKNTFELITVTHSLLLIKPTLCNFRKTISIKGKPQVRALFQHGRCRYDLVVTDPDWEKRYSNAEIGDYPFEEESLFTISLGEAFEGYHYKLVASVIELRR